MRLTRSHNSTCFLSVSVQGPISRKARPHVCAALQQIHWVQNMTIAQWIHHEALTGRSRFSLSWLILHSIYAYVLCHRNSSQYRSQHHTHPDAVRGLLPQGPTPPRDVMYEVEPFQAGPGAVTRMIRKTISLPDECSRCYSCHCRSHMLFRHLHELPFCRQETFSSHIHWIQPKTSSASLSFWLTRDFGRR